MKKQDKKLLREIRAKNIKEFNEWRDSVIVIAFALGVCGVMALISLGILIIGA